MTRLLALLVALVLPAAAFAVEATEVSQPLESPRRFVFELNGGRYLPSVNAEAGLTSSPYQDLFGAKKMWLFEAELDFLVLRGWPGTLGLGLAAGYGTVTGQGLIASSADQARAPDSTSLTIYPLSALAVYRFDWLWRRLGIPLMPFVKAGPAYTFWRSALAGETSVFNDPVSPGAGRGAKWGLELAAGLAFELNFLDPEVGREADEDLGINSSFLNVQVVRLSASNFGRTGLVLSDTTLLFGLGIEF